MRQGQGSFAAVAKVATGRLRRCDKSGKSGGKRVARVRSGKAAVAKVATE